VVAVAGNIASCTSDQDDATARLLADADAVFTAGDNAFPNGTARDYECFGSSWGQHRAKLYGVLGNHEYDTGSADAAFDWFGDRAGPRGLGYYSLDIGDWHIIVLNDNSNHVSWSAGSTQEQWLRADLAANTRTCTMAIWHAPAFLSSNTDGFTSRGSVRHIWQLLYNAGVDVVVNGHQHHYERMAPLDPNGQLDSARGIRQFNAGNGGESVVMPTAAIHPRSEVRSIAYGVLKLRLRAADYDWSYAAVPGESFTDTGTGACH